MKLITSGFVWIFLYVAAALAPLLFALIDDPPPGRDFWTELSVALGFVGLAVLALQFLISARSTVVDAPYGLDVVMQFHRQMSLVGFLLVLAHPLMLFVSGSASWELLNVLDAPWRARMGVLSVVALVGIVVTSVWRMQLRIGYELWRLLHDLLAVTVVGAALAHVELVGHYVGGTWRQVLWATMSAAVLVLLVWVRLVKPLLQRRRPWRIDRVVPRAEDTWSLELVPDGHEGILFEPGQFAWITVGRSPLRLTEHPFSFSSSAESADRVEFTIKAAGDFTSTVGDLAPGTTVYLDGPYGVFSFVRNEGAGFLFIAGGIGVTPMMSMLRTLADLGDRRRMTLIYANDSLDEVSFRDDLDDLSSRLDLEVVHVLADPPTGWDGETGFVTDELIGRHLSERPDRTEVFLCGPPPMIEPVLDALHANDLTVDRIHHEKFQLI